MPYAFTLTENVRKRLSSLLGRELQCDSPNCGKIFKVGDLIISRRNRKDNPNKKLKREYLCQTCFKKTLK